MNQSKFWIIIVVLLLMVNTVALAMLWFDRPKNDTPPPGGNAKDFLIRELNLSEDQQKQFDVLRSDHQQSVRRLMDGMRDLKDALVEAVTSEEIDSTLINNLTQQIADKERQRDLTTVYHFSAFRKILDADQKTKFDRILKQVMRMMNGPQKPPGGPPPHEKELNDQGPLKKYHQMKPNNDKKTI